MLYTTRLVRVSSLVRVTGEVAHYVTLTSDEDRLFHVRLTNSEFKTFLEEGTAASDETGLIALEHDVGENVSCVKVTPDALTMTMDLHSCPACKESLDRDSHCINKSCNGRRYQNFIQVLRLLNVRNITNQGYLNPKKWGHRIDKVLDTNHCDPKETDSKQKVVRYVTQEQINKVSDMSVHALMNTIACLLDLDDFKVARITDDIQSEEEFFAFLNTTEFDSDVCEYTAKSLQTYLNGPYGRWVESINLFYRYYEL